MEQNNFEKNVQQKLEELKIPPSDSVWTNVEKRIGKKHKDRRVFFILFFLILFLLPGGYWLFNSGKNNQQKQPVSNLIKSDSKLTNNEDSSLASLNKSVISSVDNSEKHDTATVAAKKSKTLVTQKSVIFQGESGNKRINGKQRKLVKAVALKSKEKIVNPFQNESGSSKPTNNEENEIVLNNANNLSVKKPAVSEIESKNEKNADSINTVQNKIAGDSLLNQLKSEKIAKEMIAKNDSSLKKHAEKKQKHHWAFGVTFSGGASLIGESFLGVNNNNNASYSQSSPGTAGSGGIGNGGNPSYTPSPINNSFAFIGGVFIEKNISPKSKMSLGISYKYFSLINKVGAPTGLALYQFNAVNNTNSYRNNFHYLELPVLVKFQLNKGKTLPLYWQAGINISQLISSNALQFKSNPGTYYNDNSLFNKTQSGLNTGISATLFSKQKVPVTIGPYFYYSASKLAGKGLYQNKHFSFIGIRTEILFPKK